VPGTEWVPGDEVGAGVPAGVALHPHEVPVRAATTSPISPISPTRLGRFAATVVAGRTSSDGGTSARAGPLGLDRCTPR